MIHLVALIIERNKSECLFSTMNVQMTIIENTSAIEKWYIILGILIDKKKSITKEEEKSSNVRHTRRKKIASKKHKLFISHSRLAIITHADKHRQNPLSQWASLSQQQLDSTLFHRLIFYFEHSTERRLCK